MSQVVQPAGVNEKDLVDRIAEALPMDVRADYYRELRHCRSLPENDEMLRILRIMQFLTLLIHTAPSRLAAERESLSQALTTCGHALEHTIARLDSLPQEVACGIKPEVIAAKINESLRQQFLQSTIPQTAEALAVTATQMKRATADFQQAIASINNAHRSAAAEANRHFHPRVSMVDWNDRRNRSARRSVVYFGVRQLAVLADGHTGSATSGSSQAEKIGGRSAHDPRHVGRQRVFSPAPGAQ